ncbi:MAG: DsbA family protein [Terriglobia bacterium]
MKLSSKRLQATGVILVFAGVVAAIAAAVPAKNTPLNEAAVREKVVRFVRAKFGVPDSTKLTADAFAPSPHPDYLTTTITSDDGKQKRNNPALITKDGRFLILGNMYAVSGDVQGEIIKRVREQFKIPTAVNVTAASPRPSPYPGLLATTVTVEEGQQKQTQDFYLTKDNRFVVLGKPFNLGEDVKGMALKTINTANQPSQGPLSAPVTVVEYGDLQCPTCARLHEFMENNLLPKYNNKVRVIYKDFPLAAIHDWTLTATVANQCAYQLNPETYVPLRTLIFKNQTALTAANVRDQVISFGEQVGLDRLRFAACIDSKATMPRIEANYREGQALGVQSTPTSFINGKMIVGLPEADYVKAIDDALRAAR